MIMSLSTGSRDHARRLMGRVLVTLLSLSVVGVLPAAAQGSPAPTSSDGLRVPHDVPAMEALFPDAVDGRPLFKLSLGRPSLELMGDASLGDLDLLVSELGIDRADLELAFANDPTASPVFNYLAFRVAGVSGATLVDTYQRLIPRTEADATAQRVTIDAREVVWVAIPFNPIPNIWFWAAGDTLLGIQAADQPTFQKLYRLLPPSTYPLASPSPSVSPPA